jgi:hypothetical protein
MQFLESLFGILLLIGVVVCGLTWMFSPYNGMEVAKRVGIATLLLGIGAMVVPRPGTNLIVGTLQILFAFALMVAAIIALVSHGR